MRIAVIAEDVNRTGGQERVVCELLQRLAPHHDVHLYCYTAADLAPEVTLHRLRSPGGSVMLRALWMVIASTVLVRRSCFDIILSQGGNTLVQNVALVHTCQAQRRELTHQGYWRLQPPSPVERLVRTVWLKLVTALERRAVRRCRNGRTIAVSAHLRDLLCRYHGVSPDDICVCENGVDHERFAPSPSPSRRQALRQKLEVADDELLAVFVGGLWLQKGVTHSLEALAQTRCRVKLCLAGGDDPAFFTHMAEDLGVADRVCFLPPTDRPWEVFQAGDVLLFPGHSEGFGLVALEAAACGLPIVMTPIGIAGRLVEDGVTGFLVNQDASEIAGRLDQLAADSDLRRRMGQAARERSREFSWDRQAREIEAVFAKAGEN